MKQTDDLDLFLFKFFCGAMVNSINATLVMPLANYTNRIIARRENPTQTQPKFTVARAYSGVIFFNIAFIIRLSTATALNDYFITRCKLSSNAEKLISSTVSGGLGGAIMAIPEGVIQAKQLNPELGSSLQVMNKVYQANGLFGLTRGTWATVGRSATFTFWLLGALPILSREIQQRTDLSSSVADTLSAVMCGLLSGPIITAFNKLRFDMQHNFTEKGLAPTYSGLIKKMYQSKQGLCSLLFGLVPRTQMSIISMVALTHGYHEVNEISQKNRLTK